LCKEVERSITELYNKITIQQMRWQKPRTSDRWQQWWCWWWQ